MSNTTEYSLKIGSKAWQRGCLGSLLLFLATFAIMDPPWSDYSFPAPITEAAKTTAFILLVVCMVAVTFFVFYRQQVKVFLDETGILFPNQSFIAWQSIEWYRIDFFASRSGICRLVLQVNGRKVVFLAEDGVAWRALAEDIKQRIQVHNPLAKDFRELKSSKIKAFLYITILVLIHLVISIQTNFEKKYLVIFTPVLLLTIGAILIEHIKMVDKKS